MSGTFRFNSFVHPVANPFSFCSSGLGYVKPVPERGRGTLQQNGSRAIVLGLNPQNHEEPTRG